MIGGSAITVINNSQECTADACGYVMLFALVLLTAFALWLLWDIGKRYKPRKK
jgi:ABC-type nickel/cobalt efflux system permease component RcnA